VTWEGWLCLLVIVVVLWALAREVAPTEVVLLGGLAVLVVGGLFTDKLISPARAAANFGNEGLVSIGVLFVVAAGLTETGAMSAAVERFLGRPKGTLGAQARLMFPVAAASAFLNNTPVVAMFMPVVKDWCTRQNLSPSRLYIPLSYAAVLGGVCTLIGTSTNLVVQGLLVEARLPPMGMFTISGVGVPVAVLGIGFILLTSRWLLPDRRATREGVADLRHYTVEMLVQPHGRIDGKTIEAAGLRHLPGLYLGHIERGGQTLVAVGPDQMLHGNDRLVFVGLVDSVVDLQRIRGLQPAAEQFAELPVPRWERNLVEVVVSRSCPVVGQTIRDGRFRTRYDAVVIAVHRNGERIASKIGDITLKPGDTLLLEALPSFVEQHRHSQDFYLVSALPGSEARRHRRARLALLIIAGMVGVVGLSDALGLPVGLLPAALVAAALMLLTGCCSWEQARRGIEWPVLMAIGASLGIGRAFEASGAATVIGRGLTGLLEPLGPVAVLAGVYVLTLLLTEIVTNNAAAVLAFPIARAAAELLGASFTPFAICIAIAASAGFATPIGYQTHLMVYGPGGYRFSDFLRIGIPLDLFIMVVVVFLAPVVFPF
jgi:di/tricarboxylate transporter